ncbi:carboxypeptidase-like regulatory domain-containing protein [Paraflavitalea pollutisoli]|uniref:alpha-2-macroglobulin family protein n=1 Tax=Paraflavitalea pollutisoli TaxID=3034143 RepID=UPI0023EDE32B|nr:alpha-2-macroglobulin family protein [Paraflavitalea sp. H1-2-19X]
MRRQALLLSIVLLWTMQTVAQQLLSDSRQSGVYTYVYRISPQEAIRLFKSNMRALTEQYLHTRVDSFVTDRNQPPALTPGNYIFVKAVGNHLRGELKTIGDLQIKLLRNARDLHIVLHDRTGKPITQATVKAGSRKLPFDDNLQAFHARTSRPALIAVSHEGILHLSRVTDEYPSYSWHKPSLVRRFTQGVERLIGGNDRYQSRSFFNGKTSHEQSFRGFMVFNKPIYKPGDTVRLKAWVSTTNGKPVNRPLLLRLVDRNLDTDTILTTISPYQPGGYETSFVLTDSPDLTLDKQYLLTLEEPSSRKYDLVGYSGKLRENEYALKRKVLMRGNFKYEDYQLAQVTFTARSDKKEHTRGTPVSIYCKAVDENDLSVMDGRVELTMVTDPYSVNGFQAPQVFIADTIWRHEQRLDAIGETRIVLPDSLFPRVSFRYTIRCRFLNSNNEEKIVSLSQEYKDQRRELSIAPRKDSLQLSVLEAGKSVPARAQLYALAAQSDTLYSQSIQLPANIRLDPFVADYVVATDSLSKTYSRSANAGLLQFRSSRSKDSVMVEVINPRKVHFWYSLYAGRKLIQQGQSDTLYFKERSRTVRDYALSVQYIDGNKAGSDFHTITYNPRELKIQVQQPAQVYPGQQASISFEVTDAEGQPVADADLTAYAFTRKFTNASLPAIPSWGAAYSGPRRGKNFVLRQQQGDSAAILMNWERWSREMHLDTIEYYKFLHPATIYTNTEPAPHRTTQLAPFVVLNGQLVPVQLLYIDEEPMFFNQAGNLQQYSFAVKPGKHTLRIRIHNSQLTIYGVEAAAGKKTILSINAGKENSAIMQEKMPSTLSKYEKLLWSRYMILVENNFGERLATLNDGVRTLPLNFALTPYQYGTSFNGYGLHTAYRYWHQTTIRPNHQPVVLVGPLTPSDGVLKVYDRYSQPFELEGNYLYKFMKGQIRQKQLPPGSFVFPNGFNRSVHAPNFRDFVWSAADIDSLWSHFLDHRSANEELFTNEYLNSAGNGQLRIAPPRQMDGEPLFVKNILLFRHDNPDFLRIYRGGATNLGYVKPGQYRIVYLFKQDAYYVKDSVLVHKNGINYFDAGKITLLPQDSVSIRLSDLFRNRDRYRGNAYAEDAELIKAVFNSKYVDTARFKQVLFGRVIDRETRLPLPGASVVVKGAGVGTLTDRLGNFQLRVPESGMLVTSNIGYDVVYTNYTDRNMVEIELTANKFSLSDVVVTGYGTKVKRSLRHEDDMRDDRSLEMSSQLLEGRVAGLHVQGLSKPIMMRGYATFSNSNGPLYIIDGVPVSALNMPDSAGITNIEVLNAEAAMAIYGNNAANGVILVSTKKGKTAAPVTVEGEAPVPGNQFRTNFRDYAFWQPRLRTDQQGKASFTTTFPDDMTSWRTFVIAMASDKRTGMEEGSVNAFKALSASIAIPQFAIAGDSMHLIGKTMHYGINSVSVKRSFSVNGLLRKEETLGIRNAHIDSFALTIAAQDSVRFKYTIQQPDGYFDGEERSIPVFKPGVQQTKGLFAVLDQDTSFTVQADPSLGQLTIHAESAVMPVLLDEIENLRNYEYGCNEQLASKLKALLLKKTVYARLNKDFKEERTIRDLVVKLGQNRWQGRYWGWWSNNDPIWWVSLHVTDALLKAEEQGFRITMDKRSMIDYLVLEFNRFEQADRISSIALLQRLDAKVDYARYIDSVNKHFRAGSLTQQLQILALKQRAGMPIVLDTFIAKQRFTMMRNVYWGEDSYHLVDNSMQATLAMYRLLKAQGGQEAILKKIRYYFLEKRRDGKWRNTYESSLILEAILPDLLSNEQSSQATTFTIAGQQTATINTFPYTASFQPGESVKVKKQQGMPVYFTAYQQSWNPVPEKLAGDFAVTTLFEAGGQPVTSLKGGQAVELKATVQVKADADYVMVEIPIPAGCSYAGKPQSGLYSEVHREYFKNKVSLFCKRLQKGTYTFSVSLIPRYSGVYHLNPAKAEMMYFPVFFGREGMKKIQIQ